MERKVTFGNLIKYGVLLGLALIIISLIQIYLKNFVAQDISLIFMLLKVGIYVYFVYCTIRFAVKYLYAEKYSFAKGVKSALFVGVIAAVLVCIYQYIEMKFITPDVYQEQIEIAIDDAMGRGVPEGMSETIRSMFVIMAVIFAFIKTVLISLLAALFIAPFFKKRQATIINEELSNN